MIVIGKGLLCLLGGRGRQDQQQQQQQGLLQEDNKGNEWKDQVILMSTVMVDKDRVGMSFKQKKDRITQLKVDPVFFRLMTARLGLAGEPKGSLF
jgi:hypothetical protein